MPDRYVPRSPFGSAPVDRIPRRDREPCAILARVRVGVTRKTAQLRDLTTHGARIEGLGRLQIDENVTLYLPGLAPKLAFVAWCDGAACGVEFDRPLCQAVFNDLMFEHGPKAAPRPAPAVRFAA